MTLEGAQSRKPAPAAIALPPLPAPRLPAIDRTWNLVVTGVGGTGVVTVGALIAMAAHLEGKGAGVIEMAGLAQKGGAVHIHCRIAGRPADISAIRVAAPVAKSMEKRPRRASRSAPGIRMERPSGIHAGTPLA